MPPAHNEPFFSHQADRYSVYRPDYPLDFLERLSSLAPARGLAWDCGTGNGQCARQLKRYFNQVVATDISADQLSQASQLPGVVFQQAPAERSPFEDDSVDIVTVACAVHWFDRDRFYAEVNRVLRPGGVLAVWTYFMPQVDPNIDGSIRKYYLDLLSPYYSIQSDLYRNKYKDLEFPFREIDLEPGAIKESWTGEQLLGFMGTWSARMTCLKQGGADPLDAIFPEIRDVWGDLRIKKEIHIPLYARIGIVD